VHAVGGRRILKLYPTVSASDSVTEARVLDYFNGRLPVATPGLVAHGEYENGWRYVLMSQLAGTELAAAWPAIPRPHQDRVASQAGEMLAAPHGLDPGPLHGILGPADWPASWPASARRPRSASAP
jgi:hygromycin-B 7''-O-kinase